MRLKHLVVAGVYLVTFQASGSSYCSCTGEIEVLKRSLVPERKGVVPPLTDPNRDDYERVIKVIPSTLKCNGYGCCLDEISPYSVMKEKPSAYKPASYRIITVADLEKTYPKLVAGKAFSFKYRCTDSAGPHGETVGGGSLVIEER